MVASMINGVDQWFLIAGSLLVVSGLLGMFYIRPDLPARRLQVGDGRKTALVK